MSLYRHFDIFWPLIWPMFWPILGRWSIFFCSISSERQKKLEVVQSARSTSALEERLSLVEESLRAYIAGGVRPGLQSKTRKTAKKVKPWKRIRFRCRLANQTQRPRPSLWISPALIFAQWWICFNSKSMKRGASPDSVRREKMKHGHPSQAIMLNLPRASGTPTYRANWQDQSVL